MISDRYDIQMWTSSAVVSKTGSRCFFHYDKTTHAKMPSTNASTKNMSYNVICIFIQITT